MKSISGIYLLFLVSFCLHHHQATADLITQTCEGTRFQDVCENTLRADKTSHSADLQGLAKVALTAAIQKAYKIQTKIPTLLTDVTLDPRTTQALENCIENYQSASRQLKDSLAAVGAKRYPDANIWVTAAMSDTDSCQDELQPGTSALTHDNDHFAQLCSNVLAIVNKAKGA